MSRDDTEAKTRRHCKVWLRVCNNHLERPKMGCRDRVAEVLHTIW